MLVDPKKKTHSKKCEKCSCPLYLLKVEKWKWESRRYCQRCLTPKSVPTLIDRAVEMANQSGNLRSALREVDMTKTRSKKNVDSLH